MAWDGNSLARRHETTEQKKRRMFRLSPLHEINRHNNSDNVDDDGAADGDPGAVSSNKPPLRQFAAQGDFSVLRFAHISCNCFKKVISLVRALLVLRLWRGKVATFGLESAQTVVEACSRGAGLVVGPHTFRTAALACRSPACSLALTRSYSHTSATGTH